MDSLFEELGIPSKYIKVSNRENEFVALIHKSWLKSLIKYSRLTEFIERDCFESWPEKEEEIGSSWSKVLIRIFKKRDTKVLPLPRVRTYSQDNSALLFCQLMQYVCQTNTKSLWKDAYKKYSKPETSKETQLNLVDYNEILRDIIDRIYGCPIINNYDYRLNVPASKNFDLHPNILPALCAVETLNAIFVIHSPYLKHSLRDCLTFSQAILEKCFTKPLFIVYQLLQLLKLMHNRSLTLGDISLSDIYLTEDLWIYVLPAINSNIYVQEIPKFQSKKLNNIPDCRKVGHKFNAYLKCEFCGLRTYDKVQVSNENLQTLCQIWIDGQISNFTYITALNKLSGRKLGDPNCHYVFPWVTDFASPCGKNWRDLRKSKYRLNKGDRQLDLTYENSQSQVPHHVSDVLSSITYYVYMARRTPRSVLCKNVRTVWVPAEYPSSIQRMQEWTPDECIPEFFTDASVFRSIHDDLEDLEVPPWCSGPEEFIEKHREALESSHVSERLHHWIDLTFGYKLAGSAAIKAKNVCLHLADGHEKLLKSGIVQLFTYPHPQRATTSVFYAKAPPKIILNKTTKERSRDRSHSPAIIPDTKIEDDDDITFSSLRSSPLALTRLLSKSRSSLSEETKKPVGNEKNSNQNTRITTFTSHVAPRQKSLSVSSSNSCGIYLPKEYKPELALELLEKRHAFISKTFHIEEGKYLTNLGETTVVKEHKVEEFSVQNAFTNLIFTENFEESHRKRASKESRKISTKNENQIVCNYSEIISTRRVRELQVLACLIVEIFMMKHLRALGSVKGDMLFHERLKACLSVISSCKNEIPPCVNYIVSLLLQADTKNFKNFKYPPVTDLGLPPPSAHLLLEPALHCIIPFPKLFPGLYSLIASLQNFKNTALELEYLYYFECNGEMCSEYESLERTKILFEQNIGECKVKACAKNLESLLEDYNAAVEMEVVEILLPHIIDLIESPPTSVLASWYLFDPIARTLGPQNASKTLLDSILKLYENEPNENTSPYCGKIAKLYHHSFLLRLIVRLGMKCFLDNFIAPLVEAVGRYKDFESIDFVLHTHSQKVVRKTSHLKTMDNEPIDASASDDSTSTSSEKKLPEIQTVNIDQEVFELEEEDQYKSLMEHLELNVASDLPFNHSTAEEALDATVIENLEQLRSLEELNINLSEEDVEVRELSSPIIPIPSKHNDLLTNISCDVGSKKSDSDSMFDRKSLTTQYDLNLESPKSLDQKKPTSSNSNSDSKGKPKQDVNISDMSSDSVIWLSHRLGPVLTARYLSRNLLKMLTLCYVGKENLTLILKDEKNEDMSLFSTIPNLVLGDQNAFKVLECLTNITGLYGEQFIILQYIPHMSELIALCKRKLTANLEGGLVSCLALLQHVIPFLSDSTLMDHLQDVILKNILHPIVRLLGSTKYTFPSGSTARNVLARKYLNTLYVLSVRMGSDMTRTHLAVPALQRFFFIFEKVHGSSSHCYEEAVSTVKRTNPTSGNEESHYIELCRDGTTNEWLVTGKPPEISHVRTEDSEPNSLSPPPLATSVVEEAVNQALEELRSVFTSELAYTAYLPFLKHIGFSVLEGSLKNHNTIRDLCQEYEQLNSASVRPKFQLSDFSKDTSTSFGSIGSNVALVGNRIDVQNTESNSDLLSLVSNKIENNTRHLRGNWLAYWEHEIGRSDKDTMFNFKQIKLQTFAGHTHSVKCLYVLDNENSFMSGSRDKTIKLWSLRSQGDGSSVSSCQWTYTAHKKSVLSITFVESMRLVASCDSVVHIWDPFMGVNVGHLESPRFPPVNVLKSMPAPSSLIFAATTDGTLRIIDARICNYIQDLKVSINPSGLIRCLAVSPSGNWIATGQSSGNITVLDSRTGLVISTWRAHEGEVLQVVALDNNTLISTSLDQTIGVWEVNEGKFKFHLRGATEPVHCLNIYNNELISGTTANRIGVHTSIDLEASFSSTKLRSDAFKGLLTSMAVLPLNRLLLLGADTGNITLLC